MLLLAQRQVQRVIHRTLVGNSQAVSSIQQMCTWRYNKAYCLKCSNDLLSIGCGQPLELLFLPRDVSDLVVNEIGRKKGKRTTSIAIQDAARFRRVRFSHKPFNSNTTINDEIWH